MKTPAAPPWRIPAHAQLVWRHWDGEYAFHHALSNDTHRLADLPGKLLVHLVTEGEQSAADLAQHFSLNALDVEETLTELADLDFVTCRL